MAGGGESISGSGTGVGVGGSGLFASLSEMTFNFDLGANTFFFSQGGSGNAWCMTAGPITCAGEATPSEGIYFALSGGPAEVVTRTGTHVIATAVTRVPEPTTASLLLLAAAGCGIAARRRARSV